MPPCGRSKQARIDWLRSICTRPRGGRGYETATSSGPWLFCWGVKLHALDLSFENLLKAGAASGVIDPGNKELVDEGRSKFDNMKGETLWSWAVTDAQRSFNGGRGVPGDHAFTSLWNGDDVSAEYHFMGRGGGWLVLTRILEMTMDDEIHLESLTYRQVRAISEMVWHVTNHLENHPPERAVEEAAAWIIFN